MEAVILIHGIWMKSIIMQPMAARLRKAGFQTHCFSYPSVYKTPAQNARLFARFARSVSADKVHFVAHSLGGIVLMHYFHENKETRPGRVVMLGSPVKGSSNAKIINNLPLFRLALGESIEQGLLGDIPAWGNQRQLGMIAGSKSLGVGNLLGRSHAPNDGAVLIEETRIPQLADHITLPVSHSGMLLSAKVSEQIIHFIENGYFLFNP